MTTRSWTCMCGEFAGEVTGDPALACWCHCACCRKQTGAAMQLGVWMPEHFQVIKGDDKLTKYQSSETVTRISCSNCGSFSYKVLGNGALVVPLGTLDPIVEPTCHIFVKDKGNQPVMFPELPQFQGMPE